VSICSLYCCSDDGGDGGDDVRNDDAGAVLVLSDLNLLLSFLNTFV
jgi:hypothetical protein